MVSRQNRPTELVDMARLMSLQGVEPLTLAQIAGGGVVRTVAILPFDDVVLGRDESCQLIVDEDPVSRRHAKVHYLERQPEVLDLGSTNGTFLNGKQVHRAFLKHGDRLQVGASVFEVRLGRETAETDLDSEQGSRMKHLQSLLQDAQEKADSPRQASAISGALSEIRLTSLLQIVESDRATGTLVVRHVGQEGRIHLHQGVLRHATLGRASGVKALYRLMALEEGRFELFVPGRSPEYDTIEGELSKHLLEGMRQKDELALYLRQLPEGRLVFHPDKVIAPAKVPAVALQVLASAASEATAARILECCPLPDVEVCRILLALIKHRILVPASEKRAV